MREVFAAVRNWLSDGKRCALATLVEARGGSPAPLGATIGVDEETNVAGSLGAGCYEGEIVRACANVLRDGQTRVLTVDLSGDGDELSEGGGCGGVLDIVAWRPDAAFASIASAIADGLHDSAFSLEYELAGEARRFDHVWPAKVPLVLVGGTSLAAAIARVASALDYRTIVVDPRPAFATRERLAQADEIVVSWPDECLPEILSERTPIVVLSHDLKLDLPALRRALASPAPYIGLLGSRPAQQLRRDALRAQGFDERALQRIHGPVGLDIGGSSNAETALSIVAGIVASKNGRSGAPLAGSDGTIHNH